MQLVLLSCCNSHPGF